MTKAWRAILENWLLAAAIASAAMLAVAHAFQTFGGFAPCELCLKQREVYWAALGVGLAGFAATRGLKRPLPGIVAGWALVLIFLFGAALAAYHAGVEWKWWPGPKSCTGGGSVSAGDLAALLKGARIRGPACDVAAWRLLGLSMAGWNALASVGLSTVSLIAARGGTRHERA